MSVLQAPAPAVVADETGPVTRRILVVDDAPPFRELLARGLRPAGYEVATADSGATGLLLLQTFRPHLVLSDVQMPVMSGLEFVRALRARGHEVPVLFVSGRDSDADRVAGFAAGGDGYLAKPFGWNELLARVYQLLITSGSLEPRSAPEPPSLLG